VTERSPERSSSGPPIPTLEKIRLESIARDVSREFLLELVSLFVSDVEKRIDFLADAVRERQLAKALSSVHAVKGAAASLGVLRLGRVATNLEEYLERDDWRASDAALVRLLREFAHVRSVLVRLE